MKNKGNLLCKTCLLLISVVYVFAFLKIIILKNNAWGETGKIWLTPFRYVGEYMSGSKTLTYVLKNTLGNVLIFLPLGILLPSFSKKLTFLKTVLIGAILSIIVEIFQYFTGTGISDVDDVILNIIGVFFGALLYIYVFRGKSRPAMANVISLVLLLVFGIGGIGAIWYIQPDLLLENISYRGNTVAGEKLDLYDMSAECYHMSNGSVCINRSTAKINNEKYKSPIVGDYFFKDSTIFVISENNGADTVSRAVKLKDIKATFEKKGKSEVYLWLDTNNKCDMILIKK